MLRWRWQRLRLTVVILAHLVHGWLKRGTHGILTTRRLRRWLLLLRRVLLWRRLLLMLTLWSTIDVAERRKVERRERDVRSGGRGSVGFRVLARGGRRIRVGGHGRRRVRVRRGIGRRLTRLRGRSIIVILLLRHDGKYSSRGGAGVWRGINSGR